MRAAALLVVALIGTGCCVDAAVPPEPRAWSTSLDASRAVCSQQCRWARKCLVGEIPDVELGEQCNIGCMAFLSGTDPTGEPAGTDAEIASCSHAIYLLTQTADACRLADPPTWNACIAAARPAP